MNFVDDTYFDEILQTPEGPIRVLAETHIFGTHLVLDGFLFFPLAQNAPLKIGVRQVLAIRRRITAAARSLGFTEITTGYHRVGSKRTGNTIVHTRRLP